MGGLLVRWESRSWPFWWGDDLVFFSLIRSTGRDGWGVSGLMGGLVVVYKYVNIHNVIHKVLLIW